MGIVIPFPKAAKVVPFAKAPSFTCRTVTMDEVIAAQSAVTKIMSSCPHCTGRGWIFFECVDGEPGRVSCPCGGDDENRVDLDGPDFDGAA